MANHQHVIKKQDGWALKGEGNVRHAERGMKTEEHVRQRAEKMALNKRSDVIIHRPNGRIWDRESDCNDPFPPKG
jgi:hypothetical protein